MNNNIRARPGACQGEYLSQAPRPSRYQDRFSVQELTHDQDFIISARVSD